MKRNIIVCVGALMLISTAAFAQKVKGKPAPAAAAGATATGDVYKQKTVYDFDDDVVEGDLVRPDGEYIDSRLKAKHSSLIKVRKTFIDEMLKSAEDI
jgi:hypothetical protein